MIALQSQKQNSPKVFLSSWQTRSTKFLVRGHNMLHVRLQFFQRRFLINFKFCMYFRTHAIFASECVLQSGSKSFCLKKLMCNMVIYHVTFSGLEIYMSSTQKHSQYKRISIHFFFNCLIYPITTHIFFFKYTNQLLILVYSHPPHPST